MPYLQLDVPGRYPADVKRCLAERLGTLFAEIMQTTSDRVVVAFRELGEGSLWRCDPNGATPGAVLTCDIRRGRPAEQRARLAQALADACATALDIAPSDLSIAFTQHSGDETFRAGRGLGQDWTPDEAAAVVACAPTPNAGTPRPWHPPDNLAG
jgi:phenylpyruvate tautomerase PptA (4-oxalocrotonate tautomerase family)